MRVEFHFVSQTEKPEDEWDETPRSVLDAPKRLLFGRRLSNAHIEGQLLPKTIALPIFSSDPLSSVAYGPQELIMILTLGGIPMLMFAPGIAAAVVLLLSVIVLSYAKIIKAYPGGGGDYEVAKTNLGNRAALTVASALLLDYVMTVAVSVASGTDNLISAFPELNPFRVEIAVGFIVLLVVINLRGRARIRHRICDSHLLVHQYCFHNARRWSLQIRQRH